MNTTCAQPFVRRNPLAFSALVVATVTAVSLMLKLGAEVLSLRPSVITTGIVSAAVLSALGALAVTKLGLWHQLGLLGGPARLRTLVWFLPFVVYGVLPLTEGPDVTLGGAAAVVPFGVLNAFWKVVALGLLLYAWLPRGQWFAAALAASIWAAMHLGGILAGAIVIPTLVLAASYLLLSFGFAGVWMRTRLLWPLGAAYALFEASAVAVFRDSGASNLATSAADLLPALTVSLLLAVYGLVAMPRRSRPADRPAQRDLVGGLA